LSTWTGFTETFVYDRMPMSLIDPRGWPYDKCWLFCCKLFLNTLFYPP